jgi:hypothetical protein
VAYLLRLYIAFELRAVDCAGEGDGGDGAGEDDAADGLRGHHREQ